MNFIMKYGIAYVMDLIFGDPHWFPHPVRIIGVFINFLEKILYKASNKKVSGAFLTIIVVGVTFIGLDRAELSKKQQGLLFGGGDPGWCKCGSCATPSGGSPSTAENEAANKENGYTITGSNDPVCVCQGGEGSAMQTVSK